MPNALKYLLARLEEPSTWAGLAVMATAINPKIDPDHLNTMVSTFAPLVCAGIAAVAPDPSGKAAQVPAQAAAPVTAPGGAVNGAQ